jgi:hypothetical protein
MATEEKVFIAIHDEFCGIGSTIEVSINDLKLNHPGTFEHEDLDFYKAVKIEVEVQFVEITKDGN